MAETISNDAVQLALCELHRRLSPEGRTTEYNMLDTVKRMTCADGFSLSVQGSRTHYCSPRDDFGPYHQVEVGFPSERVEAFLPFAEEPEKPTKTVYGSVPLEVVARAIVEHGGLAPLVLEG